MKIYTRTGDGGDTGTLGPERLPKDDIRVQACGDVDELNASIGCTLSGSVAPEVAVVLSRVQRELFIIGSNFALTETSGKAGVPEMTFEHVGRIEADIDRLSKRLPELSRFILPGGDHIASHLHQARAICRRAERSAVALSKKHPVSQACLGYLNRLSDLLFTMARYQNKHMGREEVVWDNESSGCP